MKTPSNSKDPQIIRNKTRFRGALSKPGGTVRVKNYWPTGQVISDTTEVHPYTQFLSKETLVYSESHKGPPFKEGGPFAVKRYSFRRSVTPVSYSRDIQVGNYRSFMNYACMITSTHSWLKPRVVPVSTFDTGLSAISFPAENLQTLAAGAWNRFSPLNTQAKLAQSIVELKRDGMPKVPLYSDARQRGVGHYDIRMLLKGMFPSKGAAGSGFIPQFRLRKWGHEYLNIVFGWRPLVSDLAAVIAAFRELDRKVDQILRDNNKGVRREGVVRRTVTNTDQVGNLTVNFSPGGGHTIDSSIPVSSVNGQIKRNVSTEEHIWFSARFRYYLPLVAAENPGFWRPLTKARLIGLDPSPALLWEVMPWSWLIDWFFNVGDVIDRLDGDGIGRLTADYAYLMRHKKVTRTVTGWTRASRVNNRDQIIQIPSKLIFEQEVSETKERIAATQFGFGLTNASLTAGQKWVLAALGQNLLNTTIPKW